MKRLLIIGSVWPEPNSSAAGTRMLQLIELFQTDGWNITYASAATPSDHRIDLNPMGVTEASIRLNCSSFDAWLAELSPAVVMFDRFMTEEQFGWRVAQGCPSALRLLDTEDLHSLRAARWQKLKQSQALCSDELGRQCMGPVLDGPEQLYQAMASSDIAQRELASIYRCDLSLMISEFEMSLLREQFNVPESQLHYLPFFAATSAQTAPDFSEREHFVSIGNFRHPPNWDAVLWLKHQLWPAIRAQIPDAQLHLYGAYPPPKATALNNAKQGFLVKGWAPDARAVMKAARVCLAPLRFGAGLKGKLLDAMIGQTPSVTTSIGAEGMAGGAQWPGEVADSAEQWVAAAVRLYQQPDQWRHASDRCAGVLAERFSSEAFAEPLRCRLAQLLAQLEVHRNANFIGAMLQHHQMRSTQYMSQWIEAKTRLQHDWTAASGDHEPNK